MTLSKLWVAVVLAVLVAGGFLYFPGHTYLHSDTQIYLPILDHLRDPTLYPKDPIALRPHVSYTIYDEMALLLKRVTGLDFRIVLHAQQIVFRFCGLLGMFLIGRALQFPVSAALLLASIYGLGATIGGPSVLIFEYEPVPRGFAGPLCVFAIGLAAASRWTAAGLVLGIAILYHPPTTVPVLAVMIPVAAWKGKWRMLGPVMAAAALTWVLSRLQAGEVERQRFLYTIEPELEKLQRMRGSYNWISLWGAQWIRNYQFLAAIFVLGWLRLRKQWPDEVRPILPGLVLYGMLIMPATWLLLDQWKWGFLTQFQPARAVLFITLATLVTAAACGIDAARTGRRIESIVWFAVAFAIPAQADTSQLIFGDLREAAMAARFGSVLVLAMIASFAARDELISKPLLAAALVLPFWIYTGPAGVRNYRNQDQPEVREMAEWARDNTPKDAVFLCPDAGQELYPGFFRVYSQRSLYVDWKGGGQVNLLRGLGLDWWERWQKAGEGKFKPDSVEALRSAGVDYLILKKAARLEGVQPVRESSNYAVYRISPILSRGQ